MTINEVIAVLRERHPKIDEEHTCDIIKAGSGDAECTGICVTVCGTADVIRSAGEMGANFLIVHEPLYWTNADDPRVFEGCPVAEQKKALLEKYRMTVWRDHDHIHGGPPTDDPAWPDDIFRGIAKELGWEGYIIGSRNKPVMFEIPETDGEELGRYLCEKLHLNGVRIVGDKHAKVKKVSLAEHIFGMDEIGISKIRKAEAEEIDAFIPFETVDWLLNSYIRDSCMLGRPRILYNTGHFNTEELGMKYLASYLQEMLPEIPVHHIFAGDTFDFIV